MQNKFFNLKKVFSVLAMVLILASLVSAFGPGSSLTQIDYNTNADDSSQSTGALVVPTEGELQFMELSKIKIDERLIGEIIPIVVEKPENPASLEMNIRLPSEGSVIKGDMTYLSVTTNKAATCRYSVGLTGPSYGGQSAPVEMEVTGYIYHFQMIEGLEETQEGEEYNVNVICEDEEGNTKNQIKHFTVDLTEAREMLILEDIEDYEYKGSMVFEISSEGYANSVDGVTSAYFAQYTKGEDYVYGFTLFEFEDESLVKETLEDLGGDLSYIENVNENKIYVVDLAEYVKLIFWTHENFLVYMIVAPNPVNVTDIEDLESMNSAPFPSPLIETYLEKYPSDLLNDSNPIAFEYGDVNKDGIVDRDDLDEYVDYVFRGGPAPLSDSGDLNNDGSLNILDLNLLVNLLFRTPPIIELINPDDNDEFRTSSDEKEISFKFIVKDNSDIDFCRLIVDGDVEETLYNPQKDEIITIKLDLDSDEKYDWYVECVDIYGAKGVSERWDFDIEDRDNSDGGRDDYHAYTYLSDQNQDDDFPTFNIPEDEPRVTATPKEDKREAAENLLQIFSLILLFASVILVFAIILIAPRR